MGNKTSDRSRIHTSYTWLVKNPRLKMAPRLGILKSPVFVNNAATAADPRVADSPTGLGRCHYARLAAKRSIALESAARAAQHLLRGTSRKCWLALPLWQC
jgi:hypothetical protein